MNTEYCIVLCSCPDSTTAEDIARQITDLKLVACTNIVPHLTSIYPWQGKMIKGCESMMIMKTHLNKLEALEKMILSLHPYEFPEFIAIPIIYGHTKYLDWVEEVVNK